MREGVAFCRACDRLWKLRELAADPEEAEADKAAEGEMPAGCWLRDLGSETVIGASCRGPTGCFFLFFAAFWNSITSVFVFLALAGIYRHLGGTLPQGLANVKGNASPGNATLGMSIFMLVFMIPFVLVGVGTASAAAIGLFGRLEVTLRGQEGTVFTGVGPIGWRRRFAADLVKSVRVTDSRTSTNGRTNKQIVIEADKTVNLGVMLSDARRRWMAGVLRRVLGPG